MPRPAVVLASWLDPRVSHAATWRAREREINRQHSARRRLRAFHRHLDAHPAKRLGAARNGHGHVYIRTVDREAFRARSEAVALDHRRNTSGHRTQLEREPGLFAVDFRACDVKHGGADERRGTYTQGDVGGNVA